MDRVCRFSEQEYFSGRNEPRLFERGIDAFTRQKAIAPCPMTYLNGNNVNTTFNFGGFDIRPDSAKLDPSSPLEARNLQTTLDERQLVLCMPSTAVAAGQPKSHTLQEIRI